MRCLYCLCCTEPERKQESGANKGAQGRDTVNTPARITKCWVMLNERLSLNLNFFISEMGTMDVPPKGLLCRNGFSGQKPFTRCMGNARSVPNSLYTLLRTHCVPSLCICWEIMGLREITDTSTFSPADSMRGKFSHSLE